MYYIELILTRQCNKDCYYCTTKNYWKSQAPIEADLDYLKYVIDRLPDEVGIELNGGEIGLIKNIDKVYQIVKDHKEIMQIKALSNGLLRKNGCDWLDEVEYWEHLIYDIKGKEIIKFYTDLDLEGSHKYIIVTTPNVIQSLLHNWEYFYEVGLFRPNFDYKIMNHKSPESINLYAYDYIKFYNKLGSKYYQRMLNHYFMPTYMKKEKELCQKYSPNPFIDFETKQIGHCAINMEMSNKVDFNRANLMKIIHGVLSENDYCKKCYSFDNGYGRSMWNNRSYRQEKTMEEIHSEIKNETC
jgi:hypothetical protein